MPPTAPMAPAQGLACPVWFEEVVPCSAAGDPAAAPTRSEILYFLFSPLPTFQPWATCSPCRSRKLFAVEAVALASASDTEDGSLRKDEAVFKAACFSAQVVPVDGEGEAAGGGEAVVERLEKRELNPVREDVCVVSFLLVVAVDSSAHGFAGS